MNILNQLAEEARERVAAAKKILSLEEIERRAFALPVGGSLLKRRYRNRNSLLSANARRRLRPKG